MFVSLVLTVQAPDKPGLVEAVAAVVARHHGSWLESRMASLAGRFAGILLVRVPNEDEAPLRADLAALQQEGMELSIHSSLPSASPVKRRILHLELVGLDRPGIVRELSQVLAASQVNIDELETRCAESSLYGGDLFTAKARLSVPEDVSSAELRTALEGIANDLMVDLSLAEQQLGR